MIKTLAVPAPKNMQEAALCTLGLSVALDCAVQALMVLAPERLDEIETVTIQSVKDCMGDEHIALEAEANGLGNALTVVEALFAAARSEAPRR